MTNAKEISPIILDHNGANEITLFTRRIEETRTKMLAKITTPTSTDDWGGGPSDTQILDLLRIEKRYIVTAYIASEDVAKLRTLFESGGVVKFTYQSNDEYINFEKLQIIEDPRSEGEQDETKIVFTGIVGVDLGTS